MRHPYKAELVTWFQESLNKYRMPSSVPLENGIVCEPNNPKLFVATCIARVHYSCILRVGQKTQTDSSSLLSLEFVQQEGTVEFNV
jgi:hypothetical protein